MGYPVRKEKFSDIDTNNIESIEVLKFAAATAIYGPRGASGVIIITTKRSGFRNSSSKIFWMTAGLPGPLFCLYL
jgi:TonB-dependent SusC/RagA subfamily outer membrane receptor